MLSGQRVALTSAFTGLLGSSTNSRGPRLLFPDFTLVWLNDTSFLQNGRLENKTSESSRISKLLYVACMLG